MDTTNNTDKDKSQTNDEMQVNEALPAYNRNGYYTYADYLTWDDDERWELIDGKSYLMSAPNRKHQTALGDLYFLLRLFLKGKKCEAFLAPFDVRLNADTLDDTVVQPDLMVVCDKSKLSDGKGVVGAPDLIIEILSPSNPNHDRVTKYKKYCETGVREFWIVDPEEKNVAVNTLSDEKYTTRIYGATDKIPVHVLPGCIIDLTEVFAATPTTQ
ncbi:MAG: Uma2 family endonuclease [Oscillospiraceae bacterium]|nr:Uma2 family endonuclease [Oscillospiraceae bacterium]MCL2279410.1 Uma2 family endonuclease [Oscillospiraceae bacterium]